MYFSYKVGLKITHSIVSVCLQTKISKSLQGNNSKTLGNKNVKFPWYYFYMNTNIYGDFQSCLSVLLNEYNRWCSFYKRNQFWFISSARSICWFLIRKKYWITSSQKLNFLKLLFSWGLKTFEHFFGRVVLWVEVIYLVKLNYFGGGYPNRKLIYN